MRTDEGFRQLVRFAASNDFPKSPDKRIWPISLHAEYQLLRERQKKANKRFREGRGSLTNVQTIEADIARLKSEARKIWSNVRSVLLADIASQQSYDAPHITLDEKSDGLPVRKGKASVERIPGHPIYRRPSGEDDDAAVEKFWREHPEMLRHHTEAVRVSEAKIKGPHEPVTYSSTLPWNDTPVSVQGLRANGILPLASPERARGKNTGRARFESRPPTSRADVYRNLQNGPLRPQSRQAALEKYLERRRKLTEDYKRRFGRAAIFATRLDISGVKLN